MTMEFLTLSDARAKSPYSITHAILQTVVLTSELLGRMSWTTTDKDQFEYEQVRASTVQWVAPGDIKTEWHEGMLLGGPMTAVLKHAVNKAAGSPKDEFLITETIMDLARDIERSALGNAANENNAPLGFTDLLSLVRRKTLFAERLAKGDDLDLLITRVGRFWSPDTCVFLMHSALCWHLLSLGVVAYDKGTRKYTYRGASVIPTDSYVFNGKIALVSLDPACGLFGIVKSRIENCPYKDDKRPWENFGPVMGWQIEAGIKEKADPSRPEEAEIADENGQFECVQISWTGAFGLKNQNAAATVEGLTCPPPIYILPVPDGVDPDATPAEMMHASVQSDMFPPKTQS